MRWGLLGCAVLALACSRDATPAPEPAASSPESEPNLGPWQGPPPPSSTQLLRGGAVHATAQLRSTSALLGLPLGDGTLSITLARPIEGGVHHRVAAPPTATIPWEQWLSGKGCPAIDGATCTRWRGLRVYQRGQTLDVFPATVPPSAVRSALAFDDRVRPSDLRGHILAHATDPGALRETTLEVDVGETHLDLRLTWAPADPAAFEPTAQPGTAIAWRALCEGALACFRLGPLPDLGTFVRQTKAPATPQHPLLQWAVAWPHALAQLHTSGRNAIPELGRGLFDQALDGLSEIAFAGGRQDDDGFIVFARLPTPWVNFAASMATQAGYVQTPTAAGNDTVSWAPLPSGGLFFALDDGPEPANGWVGVASSPERYPWLHTAARTLAPTPVFAARVDRLDRLRRWLPGRWTRWLDAFADQSLTVRIEPIAGRIEARARLDGRR